MELAYIELPSRSAIMFICFAVMLVPGVVIVRSLLRRSARNADADGMVYIPRVGRLRMRLGERPTAAQYISMVKTWLLMLIGVVVGGGCLVGIVVMLLVPTSNLQRVEADGSFYYYESTCLLRGSGSGYMLENCSADTLLLLYNGGIPGAIDVREQLILPHTLVELPASISGYDQVPSEWERTVAYKGHSSTVPVAWLYSSPQARDSVMENSVVNGIFRLFDNESTD